MNGVPAQLPVAGKRFVQILPVQPGVLRDIRNTLAFCYVSQGCDKHGRIVILETVCQVLCDLLFGLQAVDWVKFHQFHFHHSHLVYAFHNLFGFFYVAGLTGFVTATQKKNDNTSPHREINPVALASKDAHFAHGATDRSSIAQVAAGNTGQTLCNHFRGASVFQTLVPLVEDFRGCNFTLHGRIVANTLQMSSTRMKF